MPKDMGYKQALRAGRRNVARGTDAAPKKLHQVGLSGNSTKVLRQAIKAGIRSNAAAQGKSVTNSQVKKRAARQVRAVRAGSESDYNRRTRRAVRSGRAQS